MHHRPAVARRRPLPFGAQRALPRPSDRAARRALTIAFVAERSWAAALDGRVLFDRSGKCRAEL